MPNKHPHLKVRRAKQLLYKLFGDNKEMPCAYCGVLLTLKHATVDHIIPLSRGGSKRDSGNLAISCAICNNQKGNLDPEEWVKVKNYVHYSFIQLHLGRMNRLTRFGNHNNEWVLTDPPPGRRVAKRNEVYQEIHNEY